MLNRATVGKHTLDDEVIYRGDIAAGSLLVPESRLVARLLLKGRHIDDQLWRKAIFGENVLQKRSPETARRQARLIRNRLLLLDKGAWEAIISGTSEVATQFLFAACVKHSRLLGDFMDQVVRERHRTFQEKLTDKDWSEFLDACRNAEPSVAAWKASTTKKIRQIVFRILAEARYIDSTRSRRLQRVTLVPEIREYLTSHGEEYVLRCMEVNQ